MRRFTADPVSCGPDTGTPGSSSVSIIFHNHSRERPCRVLPWCLSLGCHNNISWTGWLRKSKIKVQQFEDPSWLTDGYLLAVFSGGREGESQKKSEEEGERACERGWGEGGRRR